MTKSPVARTRRVDLQCVGRAVAALGPPYKIVYVPAADVEQTGEIDHVLVECVIRNHIGEADLRQGRRVDDEGVIAVAASERVLTRATEEDVVAAAAMQGVVTGTSEQEVSSAAAPQRVIAAQSDENVVAVRAVLRGIARISALQSIARRIADNGVTAIIASRHRRRNREDRFPLH